MDLSSALLGNNKTISVLEKYLKDEKSKSQNNDIYISSISIGKGAFSEVFLGWMFSNKIEDGKNNISKCDVALKEIPKKIDKDTKQSIANEIKVSFHLNNNSNIVKILDIVAHKQKDYLVYEYCNGGDLRNYMNYFSTFNEDLIQVIMYQIVNGLEELFNQDVVHHDIKPENILLNIFQGKEDADDDLNKIKDLLKSKNNNNPLIIELNNFHNQINVLFNQYILMNNMMNNNPFINMMNINPNMMLNNNPTNMINMGNMGTDNMLMNNNMMNINMNPNMMINYNANNTNMMNINTNINNFPQNFQNNYNQQQNFNNYNNNIPNNNYNYNNNAMNNNNMMNINMVPNEPIQNNLYANTNNMNINNNNILNCFNENNNLNNIYQNNQNIRNIENFQNIQNMNIAPNFQNVQNIENVQNMGNIQNMQNIQYMNNAQNMQNIQNMNNAQNIQIMNNDQNMQNIQNMNNAQNMQNIQNMNNDQNIQNMNNDQNMRNIQNMNNVQNMQNIQNMNNAQNIQNMDNAQNMQNIQNMNNAQNIQNMDNAQNMQNIDNNQNMNNIENVSNPNNGPSIENNQNMNAASNLENNQILNAQQNIQTNENINNENKINSSNPININYNDNNQHNNIPPKDMFTEKHFLKILKEETKYKLSDFGLSKLKSDIKKRNLSGSPLYMSPELFELNTKIKDIENKKVDIWALGVLAFELFFGRRPFEANSLEELYQMYQAGTYKINLNECKSKKISKQFFFFLTMCLQKNPKNRANVFQLKESDFIINDLDPSDEMDEEKFLQIFKGVINKDENGFIILNCNEDYAKFYKEKNC